MRTKSVGVCYILSYYCPTYVRSQSLLAALNRIDNFRLSEAVNTSTGIVHYAETLAKLVRIRFQVNPDIYILGFRGTELFWPVRLITLGKPLIFDHMMSPYDSLLYERKLVRPGGFFDRLLYLYEKTVLAHSDIILTDTQLHKEHFSRLYRIDPGKIFPVHVGTDESVFKKRPESRNANRYFNVLYYGSFLPLHGIDIVLDAAERLKEEKNIRFVLVGGGQRMKRFHSIIRENKLGNVHHKEWVEYHLLPDQIEQADLCLGGPFGNTGQARRVITGKTFQFLAMGKPAVVGRIGEDAGFAHGENCIMVDQGNARQLADTILWAFRNRDQLKAIGANGHRLYEDRFSNRQLSLRLKDIVSTLNI